MAEITVREFLDMPLSQAIRQVIFDVQCLVKTGVVINMDNWVQTDTKEKICAVCLGGAAIVSFTGIYDDVYPGADIVECTEKRWWDIKVTFNQIRVTGYVKAYIQWYEVPQTSTPSELFMALRDLQDKHDVFTDKLTDKELKQLYKQMNEFADTLEKHGK